MEDAHLTGAGPQLEVPEGLDINDPLAQAVNNDIMKAQGGAGSGIDAPGDTSHQITEGAGETRILNPPKPLSLSGAETRRWYLDAEAQIPDLIDRTKPLEQQAKQASALRNQVGTQAREAMTNRELANSLFGSRPNMTREEVVKKYMDKGYVGDELYQEIMKAALRSNPSVNQYLGVFPK